MDKNYLIAALFFIATIIAGVVLAYPKYQTLQSSQNKVAEKEKEYASQLTLIREINEVTTQYKKLESELALVGDLLPQFTSKSVPELFTEFEKITSESGILLSGISFQSAPIKVGSDKSSYKSVNASISAIGSYDALRSFIKTIEQNKHLMDIASLRISPPSVSEDSSKEPEPSQAPPDLFETATTTIQSSEPAITAMTETKNEAEPESSFNFDMSINVYYR